jgi:poly-beta-1,6-N-acetyl-D-glucosamine N-deacetylase
MLFFVLPSKALAQQTQVAILGFHDIVDTKNPKQVPPKRREFDTDCPLSKLETILTYLLEKNYWFLSSREFQDYFLKNKVVPPQHANQQAIMLTFDDGYTGVYDNMLPLLKRLQEKYNQQVKVVLFITPGLLGVIDGDITYTNCEDLRDGFKAGFYDVQSHGLSHQNLTKLNTEDLTFELIKSKFILRKCLEDLDPGKNTAITIAYPYGASNKQVERYVSADFDFAFAYDDQFYKVGDRRNNKYRIHRLQVYKALPTQKLIEKLEAQPK